MTYQAEVLADSPWGFWEFNETSGTVLADSSVNGRDADILNGSPALAQTGPESGTSAIQWPTGSYAHTSFFDNQPTTSTYEAWVYLTATPGQFTPIVTVTNSSGSSGATSGLFLESDGRVTGFHYPSGNITSASALTLNTWHHLISSTGAAGAKVRVDGVEVAAAAGTTSDMSAVNGYVWIHGYYSGSATVGGGAATIAFPAFYRNVQLSDTRTDAHFNAMSAAGGSELSLLETLPAISETIQLRTYTRTSTANNSNGLLIEGTAVHPDNADPVTLPAAAATRRDKALWYPDPDLVDGRPT